LRVGESCPAVFGIGLDGGVVLGEGEFETDVSVEMAVRDVVRDLTDGPASGR